MNLAQTASVLKIFALLFSNGWIVNWQKNRERQRQLTSGAPRGKALVPSVPEKQSQKAKEVRRGPMRFYERIFSLRVTLWYLIYQRLNFDQTLAAVVRNVRSGGADRLGKRGSKLSKKVRSSSTSAYNQARQRLPLELIHAAAGYVVAHLKELAGLPLNSIQAPGPEKRTRQLLDGSTLAMLITPDLAAEYAATRNQHGASNWSVMRIVLGFCARTGAVLSAVEGAKEKSEQALARIVMEAAAAFTIWIGDRNFGIWCMAAQAVAHKQDLLVRMTRSRAIKLAQGRTFQSGEEQPVEWLPSRKDKVSPGMARTAVCGRLIYVRFQKKSRFIDLWLFTTLSRADYPIELLVQWYGQRWQAELHFRSVKTQMKLAEMDVATPEMARKEFATALLAYNLVRVAMWAAGERLESGHRAISFAQTRRALQQSLQEWSKGSIAADQWTRQLLDEVTKETLPKRRKERPSEIRQVRHRPQKFPPLTGSRAAARLREEKKQQKLEAKSL